jgi:hypothetical protein
MDTSDICFRGGEIFHPVGQPRHRRAFCINSVSSLLGFAQASFSLGIASVSFGFIPDQ